MRTRPQDSPFWPVILAGSLLGATCGDSKARAAGGVTAAVSSRDGCPSEAWFQGRLEARGLRGAVRASLGAEGGGYAGEIEARADQGATVTRRLTAALCTTVAEGLLVVAEIHLSGLIAEPAAPVAAPAPAPPPPAFVPSPAPPRRPPLVRFAAGALGTLDTVVTGDAAFGGGLTGWLALGDRPLRGLQLSGMYSRADVRKGAPITHEHVRVRLDVLPFDVAFDGATSLGFSAFLSGGHLQVSAEVDPSTPGGRAIWVTGAGARVRRVLGPVFVELGVDLTLALTRRRFELLGAEAPLFSLPLFGVATTLSVGLPIAPRRVGTIP